MRLFINQANRITTDPVMDITLSVPVPITDLDDVSINLYTMADVLIVGSDIQLFHTTGGVYAAEWPDTLATVKDTDYQIEVIMMKDGKRVWYTKQTITARVNK